MNRLDAWGPSPRRVVEAISCRREDESSVVLPVYWVAVEGDRSEFQARVDALAARTGLIALLVRDGFTNVNAVAADVVRLLQMHQALVMAQADQLPTPDARLAILLLSHTTFELPQVASMVALPEWFPKLGGQSVDIRIEDLTWSATAPINAPEVDLGGIAALLLRFDDILCAVLAAVVARRPGDANALLDRVRDPEEQASWRDILDADRVRRAGVTDPRFFRPSTRGPLIISRLLRGMRRENQEGMKLVSALAGALGEGVAVVEAQPHREEYRTFLAVLNALAETNVSSSVQFAHSQLVAVSAAYHWVTKGAHADTTPPYPVTLLRALSFDVRRTLDFGCERLEALASSLR